MKKDWTIKKLDEICDVITDFVAAGSFADLRKNVVYNEHPDFAQLVRTTDLKHNFNNSGFVYVSEDAFNYLYRVNLNEDSIILPNVGVNCGEVYYITSDMLPYKNNVLGPNAVLARSHKHCNKYLYYCFLSSNLQFQISNITSKMAQPKFNKTALKLVQLPLPPLEEQKRIVAVLDKKFAQIETLKTAAEKNLQNTKQLFKAELEKAFNNTSWELKELKDVCSYYKKQGKYTNLPYIGMEDIESKTGKFIGSDEIKCVQSSTFAFDNNDVLFGRLRPYLAKVYLAEFSGHCSTEIFPIRTKENLLPAYLKMWLLSEKIINQINDTCTGARMPRADMNAVLSFEIPLPPLEEQKRIVAHLDSLSEKVHQLEEIYTKQLADCDELKQSLLQKAFEGEL